MLRLATSLGVLQNMKTFFRKALRIAPWLALGPVTGLLGWRMERSLQARDRLLAILYGLAIVSTSSMLVSGLGHSFATWLK
jgi:hypothetical protein